MSATPQSRDEISPDVLWAVESLETAREPTDLGPAFAAAEREKRRLGPFWRLEFTMIVLSGLAGMVWFSVPEDAKPIGRVIALGLLVLAVIVRIVVSKDSKRVAALKRVNDALDRWRSLVPAMREIPK